MSLGVGFWDTFATNEASIQNLEQGGPVDISQVESISAATYSMCASEPKQYG